MSIVAAEIERFDRLSATWWNPTGPMRPLHVVNALRLAHVIELIGSHFGRDAASLAGLRILGNVRTAITSTVEPFWTTLLGVVLLAQPVGTGTLVGGAAIMAAVLLLQRPVASAPTRSS